MRRFKGVFSLFLAATLIVGSNTMIVGATGAEPASSVVSGNAAVSGSGHQEGHVDKTFYHIVLPTTPVSDFNFIMDPERLIQATNAAAYSGYTFPDKAADTGVYFLTGDKTYSNASKQIAITNKSSHDTIVTIKVKATGGTLPLATTAAAVSGSAAKLYLGAVVGEGDGAETTALTASDQTITRKVGGNPDNYHVTWVSGNGYKFEKVDEADRTAWKVLRVNVEGAVTDGVPVSANTAAPTVEMTFSYDQPGENDTTSTAGVGTTGSAAAATPTATVVAGAATTVTLAGTNSERTISSVSFTKPSGDAASIGASKLTYTPGESSSTLVIAAAWATEANMANISASGTTFTITYSDTTTETFILKK